MKSKEELKKQLHRLIDSIDDEETLNMLNEDIVPLVIEGKTKESEDEYLTPEQEKELEAAIKEADNGETISLDEFLNAIKKWRVK